MTKKRHITIMGTLWDFWSVLNIYDKLFESRYISFYKPWLKDVIPKSQITLYNETSQNMIAWPIHFITRTIKNVREIRKFKPHYVVIHHDDAIISCLPTMWVCKILARKTKFVGYMHSGIQGYSTPGVYTHIKKFFIKYCYNWSLHRIVTVSNQNKAELERKFKLKGIDVIYNPIDIKKAIDFAKETEPTMVEHKKKKHFVFTNIGRLTEQKSPWYLLRAFAQLHKKHSNARLIMIGQGELMEKTQAFTKKIGIQKYVTYTGLQQNVFKYIGAADCFILSSLWEAFPQVLGEALAVNTPVIAADCSAGPRESLCPEIGIFEKITYPHFGKYGILTQTLPREYVFKTLDEKPLSEAEQTIVQAMEAIMTKKDIQKKYTTGASYKRACDFSEETIGKRVTEVFNTI
ncbi:MAG: glycosyltransferase involved in cell wall biosynthesis [Candidatus Woesearchaeota archaeon]|jgi:glycosyltransferase involved in cell wall biosynthesis